MKSWRNKQRILGVALVLALLGTMVLGSASGLAMGSSRGAGKRQFRERLP